MVETPVPPPPAPPPPAAEAISHPTVGESAPVVESAEAENPGYHYWHSKVASGEGAAPKPEPKLIAADATSQAGPKPKTIDSFAFLDDDAVVKVYISLEGDLADVADADVTATFNKERFNDTCSMEVLIKGTSQTHRLAAEKLGGVIAPDECKWKINKKNKKLIITLKKAAGPAHQQAWQGLRANVVLPYRRGGGGAPR